MNFNETQIIQKQKVTIHNLLPEIGIEQARQEIIDGLLKDLPQISSKYFYDKRGSELFEEITKLDEYYPTRTEKSILRACASELMNRNPAYEIIELGSGDCSKISILLEAIEKSNLKNVKYIPVDFSKSAVEKSAAELTIRFPELQINGYVADFIHQLNLIPHSDKPRLVCFLGSTIGNFSKSEAMEMLRNLSNNLVEGDTLLVGFDLVKPKQVLHSAYNDSKGITIQFNKNILKVVNKILETDFKLADFDHLSFFNAEKSGIEMYLVANKNCKINSPNTTEPLIFECGDLIHTENSFKFSTTQIAELAIGSGLKINNSFTDSKQWFSLTEFQKRE